MVGTVKNDDGNIPYSALSPEQRRRYDLLLAGLDLLDQAIAVFDATPKLVTWNKAMLRLLDFPESMVRVGTPFEEFARFNAERLIVVLIKRAVAVKRDQRRSADRNRVGPEGERLGDIGT